MPPYVAISLDKSGAAEYKEAPDDDNPLKFQLDPEETSTIFGLVEKLGYFRNPLESPLKVAFTGMKTSAALSAASILAKLGTAACGGATNSVTSPLGAPCFS